MALQTNVFENGEWVTRTVEARDLFRQAASPQQQALPRRQPQEPPSYGVLTRTVIDSPVFHWVLPVQLRSTQHNDVAFIGDNFVQIRELGQNVELEDIARKQDFGSRIRNACVIGLPSYDPSDTNEVYVKDEDDDFDMLDSVKPAHRGTLPPQLLVLVLEQGDLVFLYLEVAGFKNIIFVSHSEPIPDSRLVLPGYHLTVDPSSRYLTLACSETHFQVWQLEAMETLRARHDQGLPLRPVMGQPYPRALNGVIHKIEYLSPGAENDEQIILTMIIVHKGYSRIHKYDWELGDDLVAVLKDASVGWPLDQAIQMPLLVIPSTVRESFLLVTETSEAFWATLKNGGFEWEEVSIGEHDRTELHIGGAAPLWTAWSRPWRLPEYHLDKDTIWLAREDGILNFLEITAGDGLLTNVIMGEVECKIDTAFACLYDPYADILITSGDSGPGAIWKSDPRQPLKRIGTIPNWSPTVDLTSTHSDLQESKTSRNKTRSEINGHSKPDRVFACSGRGKTGSILEFRHGFEAHIGYELECGSPVKQCWQVRRPEGGSRDDFDLIVSRPDRTDVVRFAKGLDAFASMAQDQVPYDFSSTTLAVQELGIGPIVQVTTNSVTLVDITQPMSSKRYLCHEVTPGASTISNAAIGKGFIALAYHTGSAFCIQILRIEGLGVVQHASYKIEGEVTFMVFANLGINAVLLAGVWNEGSPTLVVFAAEPASSNGSSVSCAMPNTLELCRIDSSLELEAITSIVVLKETRGRSPILLGTRTGEIVTLAVNLRDLQDFAGKHEKFGFSDAYVIPMSTGSESPAVFVCCDSNVFVLTDFSTSRQPGFRKKHRLYATDVNADVASSSEYSLVSRLPRDLSRVEGRPTLILMAGSTIFVAELQPSPRPVLRHFPVLGTPNKVLYHSRLNTLIVAILEDGRPILRFIDPDTGSDLSLPTGSDGHEVEYISGLGKSGSQIVALAHWNYEKDGRTWSYIVVSVRNVDNSGTVLIVTAAKDDSRISEGGRHKIRFSTKFKRSSYPEPVWSIATEPQGLILCSGDTVQYEMLDLEQKRLRKVKEHRLSSAGSWMEVVDEKLHAVTVAHSLEIVDYHSSPDSETMARLYSDDRAKHTIHCIQAVDTSCKGLQPITLLSDQYCGLWGMWAPPNGMDRPLKTIFQGELQASVRRFTRAKARPQWSAYRQPRYGYIKSSPDAADILGVSIDGSLRHFTILNVDAWRLLKFVQNLASRSPGICPFSTGASAPELEDEDSQDFMEIEWDPEPSASPPINMQVDGDILQRVLDKQALENLVPAYAARFRELLDALDGGEHTQQFKESGELPDYYDLAYEVLEYFLSPVL